MFPRHNFSNGLKEDANLTGLPWIPFPKTDSYLRSSMKY